MCFPGSCITSSSLPVSPPSYHLSPSTPLSLNLFALPVTFLFLMTLSILLPMPRHCARWCVSSSTTTGLTSSYWTQGTSCSRSALFFSSHSIICRISSYYIVCISWYDTILWFCISYPITSHRITSHRITSHHIVPYCDTSFLILYYLITSHHITSHHINSSLSVVVRTPSPQLSHSLLKLFQKPLN